MTAECWDRYGRPIARLFEVPEPPPPEFVLPEPPPHAVGSLHEPRDLPLATESPGPLRRFRLAQVATVTEVFADRVRATGHAIYEESP